jgi:hypothetical protein
MFIFFLIKKRTKKIKSAKKNDHVLYQYQQRPGESPRSPRSFPVLVIIDFDLSPFFFEAGFIIRHFEQTQCAVSGLVKIHDCFHNVTRSLKLRDFLFIFFVFPKKTNQKKGNFYEVFFIV